MKLLHVGLIVPDLGEAAQFYEGVLGLQREARPDLGFDGIFYAAGEGSQIHLMLLPDPYEGYAQPLHGGRDRHVALAVENLEAIRLRLDAVNISYTLSKSGRAALFCRDPAGNAIELCEEPA